MAGLLGLRALLAEPPPSRTLEARQRAFERIALAQLEIVATEAELDCEAERASQASGYLARQRSAQVQGFTLASIASATLSGIASVVLSTSNASDRAQIATAVGGGTVTGALGIASLYVEPHILFAHPRNLLTDVWRGPAESSTYPPIVWAYLSRPEFSNDQRAPVRAKIVARWTRFDTVAHDARAAQLLFGGGGSYGSDDLRTRASMLNQVEAEVALEDQDLAALAAALAR